MTSIYSSDDPTQLYVNAFRDLYYNGVEVGPRGKLTKELRPAVFEFTNPLQRVTFARGRVINPFFQLAESLWILAGGADVAHLVDYNKRMSDFSDDGVYFNAPYGERLRAWGKNSMRALYYGTVDQLVDVCRKLQNDHATRQAVALIYNPLYDNADVNTKDRPCNIALTFKIRDNKLDLVVFNRSNDLHWGVFGANLVQFSTIQEAVATWLGAGVGTYYQITDSLHIYMEDYGAKENDKLLAHYENLTHLDILGVKGFYFNEPHMSADMKSFHSIMNNYYELVDPHVSSDTLYENTKDFRDVVEGVIGKCPDDYLRLTFHMMVAYQAHKRGKVEMMLQALDEIPLCSWKISGLRLLYSKYKDVSEFKDQYYYVANEIVSYIEREDVDNGGN